MKYINTKKIEKINLNKDNFCVVMDFDKTITNKDSMDSWEVSGLLLESEYQKKSVEIYEYYSPIELDYNMDIDQKEKYIKEWYIKSIDLYFKYGLSYEKLYKSVKKGRLIFRNGVKEFINKLKENQIPVIILSAGIGNVIEQFLKNNNCLFENMYIISNFIEFEADGKMKKFDNDKIIHTLNKTMEGNLPSKWQGILKNRKYKILIGDLVEDTKMVNSKEWDTTIKIGLLDKKVKENLTIYNKSFDIVLTHEDASFESIKELI